MREKDALELDAAGLASMKRYLDGESADAGRPKECDLEFLKMIDANALEPLEYASLHAHAAGRISNSELKGALSGAILRSHQAQINADKVARITREREKS